MLPYVRKWRKKLPTKEIINQQEIIKTSLPMMITSISLIIMNQTDVIMIGMYRDINEV